MQLLSTSHLRRGPMLVGLVVLTFAWLTLTPGGARAAASGTQGKIVFTCGANLCSTDGLGHHRRQLTHGGGHGAVQYIEPSLSADGRRMVLQGPDSQAYTADGQARHMHALTDGSMPAMQPQITSDGRRVAWETLFILEAGGELTMHLETFGGAHERQFSMGGSVIGFAPGNRFFCDVQANQLRVDASPDTTVTDSCPHVVADDSSDPNAQFGDRPHYAPNGRVIVDSISDDEGIHSTGIYLYDPASGRRVRRLTTGNDSDPVFSPDGAKVLFDRGNAIWTVSTHGGRARRLIAGGQTPTWSR
jgi:hypothetical protein